MLARVFVGRHFGGLIALRMKLASNSFILPVFFAGVNEKRDAAMIYYVLIIFLLPNDSYYNLYLCRLK
jgi:hypothetical protein